MSAHSGQEPLPNLLRERRQELGLPAELPPWRSAYSLLLRGSLFGAGVLLLALASLVLLRWVESRQEKQLQPLEPVEQQLQSLEDRLRARRRRLDAVRKDNLKIAETLVAVQSGSPLLEQLRRVTPLGVQLEEVSIQADDLIRVSGMVAVVGAPGPLERINALVLNLANLPMSHPKGVKVVKVIRDDEQPAVSFSLDWALDSQVRPSIQQLQQLGATGLVQRYRLLERQGVAP